MKDFNSDRKQISSSFISTKIAIGIAFFSLSYYVVYHLTNDTVDERTFLFSFFILFLVGFYIFIGRQIQIDYNFLTETLYVIDKSNLTEIAIPISDITGIYHSQFGLASNHSYIIYFLDKYQIEDKVRLHPKLFDNTINQIITDAQFKNPELPVTKWSFGWTSFFK